MNIHIVNLSVLQPLASHTHVSALGTSLEELKGLEVLKVDVLENGCSLYGARQ